MQLTDEEKALVEKHRAEQKRVAFTPKTYSHHEKGKAFDALYNMALEELEVIRKEGQHSKDIEHWMYEQVMGLLGEGVWEVINAS